ncbi:MAG: hypothetical protein ACRDFS_12625 [Chloroflexota bacterium]
MLHGAKVAPAFARINPLAPAMVVVIGLGLVVAGDRQIGVGVVIGALLAVLNSALLSRRIDLAAEMSSVGHALLIMQLGFLVTCTIIGVATIVLALISVRLAVANAAAFFVTEMVMFGLFFFARPRSGEPASPTS